MAEQSDEKSDEPRSWWSTLPGILTAGAGFVTAITGLALGLNQAGFLGGTDSVETTTSAPADELSQSPTEPSRQLAVPGTDEHGFKDYPGARCDPGTPPAVMARTNLSAVVICRAGPGNFYYRAVRVSDGAGIELANAVRSSGGFDVTNPIDGTRYQVGPHELKIVLPDGRVHSESMIHYESF